MEIKEKIEEYMGDLSISDTGVFDYINYENSDYICDAIMSYADSSVDYTYHNLIEWIREDSDNVCAVEEALGEFGTPKDSNGNADFYKIIQQGQYYKYEQDCYNEIDDIIKYATCQCLIDLIEEENELDFDDVYDFVENINLDQNDRCEDILDAVKEFLNKEDEE